VRLAYLVPGRGRQGEAGEERWNATLGIRRGKHTCKHQTHYALVGPIQSMASKRGGRFMEVLYMLGFGQVAYPSNSTLFFLFK
jgi:hypothetical protein